MNRLTIIPHDLAEKKLETQLKSERERERERGVTFCENRAQGNNAEHTIIKCSGHWLLPVKTSVETTEKLALILIYHA